MNETAVILTDIVRGVHDQPNNRPVLFHIPQSLKLGLARIGTEFGRLWWNVIVDTTSRDLF